MHATALRKWLRTPCGGGLRLRMILAKEGWGDCGAATRTLLGMLESSGVIERIGWEPVSRMYQPEAYINHADKSATLEGWCWRWTVGAVPLLRELGVDV